MKSFLFQLYPQASIFRPTGANSNLQWVYRLRFRIFGYCKSIPNVPRLCPRRQILRLHQTATQMRLLSHFCGNPVKPSILLCCRVRVLKRAPSRSHCRHNRHPHHSPHLEKARYQTRYFTQNLDHFNYNPDSYKTFQQRYLINDTYWGGKEKQSPIFVFIGHSEDIKYIAENTGLLHELSPTFKALIVFIEHRYYGQSFPFGSEKIAYQNTSNLGYLSSSQALADVATLVTSLKSNLSAPESPVIVFGGAYGGMLASWFRLKYPHIALGALASSAPVLLFDENISPYKMTNIITEDYKNVSESCHKTIKNSWEEIEKIAGTKGGEEKLAKTLRICKGVARNEIMVTEIFDWIEMALTYAAISDYSTHTDIHFNLPAYPVRKICEAIDKPEFGNDTISRLYGAMNVFYNNTGKEKCFNVNSVISNDTASNGWHWQGCTEMILPEMKNDNNSLFPITYKHKITDMGCSQFFGIQSRPHWITTEFGGENIKSVLKEFGSNIIFSNGLRDPISGGSVVKSISKSIVALTAQEGAHTADLFFSAKDDPEWLQRIRKKEVKIIRRWLQQYYSDAATV